jgi:hypothetical protein
MELRYSNSFKRYIKSNENKSIEITSKGILTLGKFASLLLATVIVLCSTTTVHADTSDEFVITPHTTNSYNKDEFKSLGPFKFGLAKIEVIDSKSIYGYSFGYIDRTGKEVIEHQYGTALDFTEGLGAVEKDGHWQYLDTSGRVVIDTPYPIADAFIGELAIVGVEVGSFKYGFIDKTGKEVIKPQYQEVHPFSEGLALVEKNDKYGYIDRTGKEVIPIQ